MTTEERSDPYLGHRFVVEIDSVVAGGFSGVSGLSMEMQPQEVEEGGQNGFSHKLPTRIGHQNLVLKRGLTDYVGFWSWIWAVANGSVTRKRVDVYLQDAPGPDDRVWGWSFASAYPVKWTGPEFSAEQSAVALETLELAHEGVSKVEGLPPT
ncbi:phage tail protein [Halogeometricum sp. S1BR25-6]|uniref:Phage tail protein n=1 Tax=Halogeometricum salsisoli TaxID=2950536 RepID=A0ABU2GJX6_9EURY|nr:phage tail protein [Halogeometricum sp. S1BR25-6]MDS0301128.1 phage tail protein [Halogeometricum sp. S1BR25-6]